MVDINCDMGESFSIYRLGDDASLLPHIHEANVACGFHASDPNHMFNTIELCKQHNVRVGAHFSLPDLAGFGRREMKLDRAELKNIILYQLGALKEFLNVADISLSHLKPHGALYGMASREEEIAHSICDAIEHLEIPIFGLAGTLHEEIYSSRGIEFKAEFFADLDYGADGKLLITREHQELDPERVANKVLEAVEEGMVHATDGKKYAVKADTVCVHSDTPNAVDIVIAINNKLNRTP